MNNEEKDPDLELMGKHVNQLAEHFETVQLFCCNKDGEDSIRFNVGAGNLFTRYGQIAQWMIGIDEECRIEMRKEKEGERD